MICGFCSYVCEKSGGADYVFPDDLEENVKKLHEFLYDTEDYHPSGYVLRTSESIEEKKNGGNRKKANLEEERWTEKVQVQPETTQTETGNEILETETESEFWEPETAPETEQQKQSGYEPWLEAEPETSEIVTEPQQQPELQMEDPAELQAAGPGA